MMLLKMNGAQSSSPCKCYIIIFVVILFCSFWFLRAKHVRFPYTESELKQIEAAKKCYESKKTDKKITLLNDVMTSKPKLDRTIFFHDTSCKSGIVSFTPRQACAIESAAKWNPSRDIFVLFAAPLGLPSNGQADSPILKALSSYINIQYRNVDWYKYAVDTPAEEWVKNDKMLTTEHFKGHLSDFIRLLSLYKFGGIHLDLDFIVQKTFEDLPLNFFGAQDDTEVQNAVYGLESRNLGHTVVDLILRNFTEHYTTKIWFANGPTLITNILKKICQSEKFVNLKPDRCWGVKVYDPPAFFPIHHSQRKDFFETNSTKIKELLHKVENSFAVHFNNYATHSQKILKSQPTNIYQILAEENCPKVIAASGNEF